MWSKMDSTNKHKIDKTMTPVIYHSASTVGIWNGVPQSDDLQLDLRDSAPKIIKAGAQNAVQRS